MPEYKIDCTPDSDSFIDELAHINTMIPRSDAEFAAWFFQCAKKASNLPGGFIKKILWDAEGGYPEFSHGTIQYSPRPFVQGYGCDGTTDSNIHLIAFTLCQRLGIDYVVAYVQAYNPDDDTINWIRSLPKNQALIEETILPENTGSEELGLMLYDLYQINNRSLVCALEDILEERGIAVGDWT